LDGYGSHGSGYAGKNSNHQKKKTLHVNGKKKKIRDPKKGTRINNIRSQYVSSRHQLGKQKLEIEQT